MNIVYICARFYPYKGGAEENTYQLAKRMVTAGHQVTILTTDVSTGGEKLLGEEVHTGMRIIRTRRWNQQLNLGFYPGMLTKLIGLKADLIHYENGPGFIWQEWCLIAKRLLSPRTKFVATPHGPFLTTYHHQGWKKLLAIPGRFVGNLYFKLIWSWLFHLVLQVSPTQEEWMRNEYWINPRRIKLVPNGIESKIVVDSKPSIQSEVVTITSLGRIEAYKGVPLVVQALAKLKAKGINNFRYVIMGRPDETYQAQLVSLVSQLNLQQEIEFLLSPSDEKRDKVLLEQSEVHVLFSEWEATGIVLLEAMAKGNVVITSDRNQAASMVTDKEQVGFTVEYPDVDQLAAILEKVISDKALRQKLIKKGLVHVQKMTWENIFPNYQKYLLELLDR